MDSEDNLPRHAPWMRSRAEKRSPKKRAMWHICAVNGALNVVSSRHLAPLRKGVNDGGAPTASCRPSASTTTGQTGLGSSDSGHHLARPAQRPRLPALPHRKRRKDQGASYIASGNSSCPSTKDSTNNWPGPVCITSQVPMSYAPVSLLVFARTTKVSACSGARMISEECPNARP